LPEETLPTAALAFAAAGLAPHGLTLDTFAARLRTGVPAIIGRIVEERFLLDPRTIFPDDDSALLAGLRAALAR
jgi:L-seryl-tRNA(Ser) seleniumtransferase